MGHGLVSDAERRLDAADAAIRRHLSDRPGVGVAFLAGSLVEGYGNPTSDIDVLVLDDTDGPGRTGPSGGAVFRFGECVVEIHQVGEERLDIETRPLSAFLRLVADLRDMEPTQQAALSVDEFAFQFLHQVRVGRGLIGQDRLEEIRSSVPWPQVAELLRRRRQSDYVGHAEDAVGAITADDAPTAMLTSRRALGSAIDCLTAGMGHTNPKEKWRYRKLAALGRDDLMAQCLELECDADPTAASILRTARRRLIAAQGLISESSRAVSGETRDRTSTPNGSGNGGPTG